MAFLEISGLSKAYGHGEHRRGVLGGIDLKVEEGEFVAIVGFSGSGKTTLISAASSFAARRSAVRRRALASFSSPIR